MSENDAEAKRWLQYSQEDLNAAVILLAQEGTALRHVCWFAQQSAEKAIKGALTFLQIPFPKSHDLDTLLNLLPEGWHLKKSLDLSDLSE